MEGGALGRFWRFGGEQDRALVDLKRAAGLSTERRTLLASSCTNLPPRFYTPFYQFITMSTSFLSSDLQSLASSDSASSSSTSGSPKSEFGLALGAGDTEVNRRADPRAVPRPRSDEADKPVCARSQQLWDGAALKAELAVSVGRCDLLGGRGRAGARTRGAKVRGSREFRSPSGPLLTDGPLSPAQATKAALTQLEKHNQSLEHHLHEANHDHQETVRRLVSGHEETVRVRRPVLSTKQRRSRA